MQNEVQSRSITGWLRGQFMSDCLRLKHLCVRNLLEIVQVVGNEIGLLQVLMKCFSCLPSISTIQIEGNCWKFWLSKKEPQALIFSAFQYCHFFSRCYDFTTEVGLPHCNFWHCCVDYYCFLINQTKNTGRHKFMHAQPQIIYAVTPSTCYVSDTVSPIDRFIAQFSSLW